MDNKTLGIILIIFSILLAGTIISFKININNLIQEEMKSNEGTCYVDGECIHDKYSMPVATYGGFGVIVLTFALGIYLIFFEKGTKAILSRLEETSKKTKSEEKFELLLSALDKDEKKVMKAVKEQEGITQSTLRFRTDLSKTKLSLVLTDLEKKELIKKVSKGKTNQIYLKKAL